MLGHSPLLRFRRLWFSLRLCTTTGVLPQDPSALLDSNLRSRLRSPFPGMALTCRNVLADVLPGRVSGATYLVELPVLQPRV